MKQQLTDVLVKNLPAPDKGQHTVRDTVLPGFGVRVSQGGTKTFIVIYGKTRKQVTVGRYPLLSLGDARKKAREILLKATVYQDDAPLVTFDEAVERYLKQRKEELKHSTWWSYKTLLERNFSFGGMYLSDIQTPLILDALDRIQTQSQKAHSYTAIKVFMNWCLERHYVKANPLAAVKKPKMSNPKERVLTDDELAEVWRGCEGRGRYGAIVRLLMITGQRRNQISCLQESWVDFKKKEITFPAVVMKNNTEHVMPLSTLAEWVLRQCIPYKGYYFSPVGLAGHPYSAWSKSKRALDAQIECDTWVLHDLRRTWSTNAARLDVPPHITDRVLSHTTGTLGPVAKIYNRWKYQNEIREAMDKMNSHLLEIIG